VLALALFWASSARAASPIEGVWAFEGGKISVAAEANGTFTGTVVAATSFSSCTHPVGQMLWTGMAPQSDGSLWGYHQWFTSCVPNPTLGRAAWRVLEINGATRLIFCTNPPRDTTQPKISPAGVTSGADECRNLAPIPDTTIASGPSGPTASAAASFAFVSTEPGTFECRLDSTSAAAWGACASPKSYAALAQGPHSFEVRALDSLGNADPTPAEATFSVDTEAPETTIDSAPLGTIAVTEAELAFSSADASATFECRLDSDSEDDWEACGSPVALTALVDGEHAFEVRAIDLVGNTDPSPATMTFAVDTIAPDTAIDLAPAPKVDVSEAAFAFSAPGAAGFECRIDSAAENAWAPCISPVVLTGLGDGSHTFEVRAVDPVGNTETSPAVFTFAVDIPVNGAKLAVVPLSGKVRIRTPDIKRFRPLTEGETIPVGSLVDTTEGKVRLISAGADGVQQQASFSEGIFGIGQKLGSGLVVLKLRGKVGGCASPEAASASGRSGRRLWGSGKGQFRTTGSYGSATVRGTIWFTEDRCDGTFFQVTRGIVGVRDFPRHKMIAVPAGESYLAKKPAGP
jgi:hypothetical protein